MCRSNPLKQLVAQFIPLEYPATDFSGKYVIVTGANGGLGLEAARHFVRLNAARVILGCRDVAKGEAAKNDIELSERRLGVVEVWGVDLASFDSVAEFCARADKLERLDVLVENAGVATGVYEVCEGYERQVTVNVLSTFLITLQLLPTLRRTTTRFNTLPHIVVVASDAHYYTAFPQRDAPSVFEALRGNDQPTDRYNVTKLLQVLVVRELAAEMDKAGAPRVVLNALTPGLCRTDLFREVPFPVNLLFAVGLLAIGRTPEMGSRNILKAATAGEETHGNYIGDCALVPVSSFVRSPEGEEAQKKVFKELLFILEKARPGVVENIWH